jgi:type I restriction enzyme S subunit
MNAWPVKKLGEVLSIQNGYAFSSNFFGPSGKIGLIRIRDLRGGIATETFYSGDYDPSYVVEQGDFLIGMDGEFRCYEWKGEPALLNQRVCRIKVFDKEVDPTFVFRGLNTHLKEIEDGTGYTTVKHLSSKTILGIEMGFPPIEEQARIVALIEESMAKIDLAQANLTQADVLRDELSRSVVGRLFIEAGDDWSIVTLPDISENMDSLRVPITKKDRSRGSYPYYALQAWSIT